MGAETDALSRSTRRRGFFERTHYLPSWMRGFFWGIVPGFILGCWLTWSHRDVLFFESGRPSPLLWIGVWTYVVTLLCAAKAPPRRRPRAEALVKFVIGPRTAPVLRLLGAGLAIAATVVILFWGLFCPLRQWLFPWAVSAAFLGVIVAATAEWANQLWREESGRPDAGEAASQSL